MVLRTLTPPEPLACAVRQTTRRMWQQLGLLHSNGRRGGMRQASGGPSRQLAALVGADVCLMWTLLRALGVRS